MLPPLDHIACTVAWTDPVTGAAQQHASRLPISGCVPLTSLYLLKPDNVQAMAELDDRIQQLRGRDMEPTTGRHRADPVHGRAERPGQFSMFESGPLLRNLRSLLTHSRPLRASDVRRANDATPEQTTPLSSSIRLASPTPLATLTTLAGDIDTFVNSTLAPLLADTTANRAQIIAQRRHLPRRRPWRSCERAARLALPSSGWGFVYAWLHQPFVDLLAKSATWSRAGRRS